MVVRQALPTCPDCGGRLGGVHVGLRRQVVALPAPAAVIVTEYQRWTRRTGGRQAHRALQCPCAPSPSGSGALSSTGASSPTSLRWTRRPPLPSVGLAPLAFPARIAHLSGPVGCPTRQQASRARGASAGRLAQDQRRRPQPAGLAHPDASLLSRRYLDGAGLQPPDPISPTARRALTQSLNTYRPPANLTVRGWLCYGE